MRRLVGTVTATAAVLLVAACDGDTARPGAGGNDERDQPRGAVVLATTSRVEDSGLLEELVPIYQAGSDCRVTTVVGEARRALALGADGDADVLLVDAPAAERSYMAAGNGISRTAVLHSAPGRPGSSYHVIVVRHAGTNRACAEELADWFVGSATQKAIGEFEPDDGAGPPFRPAMP